MFQRNAKLLPVRRNPIRGYRRWEVKASWISAFGESGCRNLTADAGP
jgi:hypothetical protein